MLVTHRPTMMDNVISYFLLLLDQNLTQTELVLLKQLWDKISSVLATFSSWASTPWKKVQADTLLEETKKIAKEIRTLPREVILGLYGLKRRYFMFNNN